MINANPIKDILPTLIYDLFAELLTTFDKLAVNVEARG